MEKSTHRGHCQICGRIQAITPRGVAKHGYTVDFGFFQGVCQGSDSKPLEQDRSMTDSIAVALEDHAVEQQRISTQYETGERKVTHVMRSVIQDRKYVKVRIEVTDASVEQYEIEDEKRRLVHLYAQDARASVQHAHMLLTLATQVHGQALLPIKAEPKATVVAPVVNVVEGTVVGTYKTKAARQADLDKLSFQYEKLHRMIQQAYLRSSDSVRNDPRANEIYYGPNYLNGWRAKHSQAVRVFFPELEAVVVEIEQLVKTREAVKNA
jgi:hypothetical protein